MRPVCQFGLALLLFCVPALAHAQQVKSYGDFGDWSVSLAKDPHNDEYCLAGTKQPPAGPAQNLSFAVDSNYTRIFLGYQGPALPTPDKLQLSADGHAIVSLDVLYPQSDFGDGLHLIVVELPPNMLQYLILPALVGKSAVTVRAGALGFTVPVHDFSALVNELSACAQREKIDDSGL